MTANFCVRDPEIDQFVSQHIISGEGWEVTQVNKVIDAVKRHPEAVFLGKK